MALKFCALTDHFNFAKVYFIQFKITTQQPHKIYDL